MPHVLIIGGGIIGLSSAYYLQKAGHKVTLLDKGDLVDNCSSGNAGMIVPSHFIPLAAPGMIKQGIRWMFDSKSPFYVKPSLNPQLISWGLKFMKYANDKHVQNSAVPLRDLSLLSKKLYSTLGAETGIDFGLSDKGILMFYKTEQAAEEEAHLAHKAKELGLDMDVLTPEQCKALQPELNLDVLGAVHYRCDGHIYPNALIQGLIKYLQEHGVEIHWNQMVTRIEKSGKKITKVFTGDKEWTADQYVIAGGSWSPAVAKMVDIKAPLMPGKGYSFMVPEPQNRMTIPALLAEARVAITPMNGHLRYGGTMELDKINNRINMKRVEGIVESVPKYFPDLHPQVPAVKDIWYGFRPASPDGLPYIGRSGKYDNLIVATGHGMMGLSLGPATGYLVNEVVSEKNTAINISAFSPDRF
ncbi:MULTISPECIES: NAD(P)/FAD-dependent oxidoreductase [unclassified Mucilaginibacter]|uniref:NAD(P)/FAD-dependent oxidoreductase n=1 Tax=unclassified Mucilaginibacter TaxID=2617802 RepID=UPI000963192A|nr:MULTISPECIES: FAD-dependent oxidoreductase [unclassified Mucilaginibacter]OJW13310.1 MAG: amino acid dehydrogenase [Mucilaginibacter sp. 44-25]PLW91337.1 MAG: amino acid dehydrogenase [Mucilaginibacter sp.]HEK21798.1 FAD-dependent oxidoreductase [Bacteroidota bacterium]